MCTKLWPHVSTDRLLLQICARLPDLFVSDSPPRPAEPCTDLLGYCDSCGVGLPVLCACAFPGAAGQIGNVRRSSVGCDDTAHNCATRDRHEAGQSREEVIRARREAEAAARLMADAARRRMEAEVQAHGPCSLRRWAMLTPAHLLCFDRRAGHREGRVRLPGVGCEPND